MDDHSDDGDFRSALDATPIIARLVYTLTTASLFALANFSVAALWQNGPSGDFLSVTLFGVTTGICVGQVNVIAVWSALTPGRLIVRMPWAILLTILMWYPIALGMHQTKANSSEIAQVGMVLLLGQLIAQLPLWIGSKSFGLRLATASQIATGVTSIDRQFSIKHLLVGTFLLAAALALARRLPIGKQINLSDLAINDEIATILVSVVVCNSILVAPTIWASFQRLSLFWIRSLSWGGLAFIMTIVQFIMLCAMLGDPGNDALEIIWVLLLVNTFQCIAAAVAMLLFRLYGCQLVWLERQ